MRLLAAGCWKPIPHQGGQLADFAVLSQDIFNIDPRTIATVKALRTAVGGKDSYVAE